MDLIAKPPPKVYLFALLACLAANLFTCYECWLSYLHGFNYNHGRFEYAFFTVSVALASGGLLFGAAKYKANSKLVVVSTICCAMVLLLWRVRILLDLNSLLFPLQRIGFLESSLHSRYCMSLRA